MIDFNMTVAGCKVAVKCRHKLCLDYCREYITEDEGFSPSVSAFVSDEELKKTVDTVEDISEEYAEFTGLYRPLADHLPREGGFVIHGACISFDSKAYLFTAPSGTGKSTHIRLWKQYLGDGVGIVNGDKPVITAKNDKILIHGTPWAGKERWQRNVSLPLEAICILTRGRTNSIRQATADEFLPFLLKQTYLNSDPVHTALTLELLDEVLKMVKVYILACNISEDAVKTSFEAMTGKKYK
ncbi:MAG: hypothetical protein E7646_05655 [Ruminococcaceae bacterium]|nr:hypothetical protein [Oscillospiraceae bacterium]